MDELLDRINSAEKAISTIKNKVAYRDLRTMLAHVDTKISEISKESVECRRLKKNTPKYNDLVQEASTCLDNLEEHITLAVLLG